MAWQQKFSPLAYQQGADLPSLAIAHLSDLGMITMTGDDKKSYLQGQVTCDVVTLEQDQSTLGAHCDAKGKVWSLFRLFHHFDGYGLIQSASAIEKELTEIKKYAIFSKVEIKQSEDVILGVMGEQAQSLIDSLTTEQGNVRTLTHGTAVKVSEQRWMLIVSSEHVDSLLSQIDAQTITPELWHYYDIIEAMPTLPASAQNQHIPQAFNLQALGGISFKKGCYTGQETVARAKYRGTNKRALYIVKGTTEQPLNANEPVELERAVGENWRSAGVLLTHFQCSDDRALGLIILSNDLEPDTNLRLAQQPTTQWHIEPLPYSLDDE